MIGLVYGDDDIRLPAKIKDKLEFASECDLRVLLTVACNDVKTEADLASMLSLELSEVKNSIAFWRGADIITTRARTRAVPPSEGASMSLTADDVDDVCKNDLSVKGLIDKCQLMLHIGTMTHADTQSIIYLKNNLKLDSEYILILFQHFADREKMSVKYIETAAISFYDKGIVTVEALEKQLTQEKRRHETEIEVARIFGAADRPLSQKEKAFISDWTEKWHMSLDEIRAAYDAAVDSTHSPSFQYANAVLKNRYESQGGTSDQTASPKRRRSSAANDKAEASFDLDEIFSKALARGNGAYADTTDKKE